MKIAKVKANYKRKRRDWHDTQIFFPSIFDNDDFIWACPDSTHCIFYEKRHSYKDVIAMERYIKFLAGVLIFMIFGCTQRDATQPNTKSSLSTQNKGEPVKQQGPASWYGDDFQGKKTASGEPFDQDKLTAASKTLPLGSKAEVTNVETGDKVTVQVTDRGPYVGDRVMDLSKAAAEKIGIKKEGVAEVKIKAHKPVKKFKRNNGKKQKLAKH